MVFHSQKARLAACLLLFPWAIAACGGSPEGPLARNDFGEFSVDPSTGVLAVEEGETFSCRLRFEPGETAWPKGAQLFIYPPATQAPKSPEVLSAELVGEGYRLSKEAYRAASVSWPGRSGRYRVAGAEGAAAPAGSLPFELRFDSVAPRHYFSQAGPCDVSLSAELVAADGEVLFEFTMPRWTRALEPPARLRCILPSEARVGEPVILRVTVTSWRDNPVLEAVGVVALEAQAGVRLEHEELTLDADADGVATTTATFQRPGVYRLRAMLRGAEGLELAARGNPIIVTEGDVAGGVLLWGDLHNHSIYSFDTRTKTAVDLTPREVIEGARRRYGVDFIALTDHAQTIPPVQGDGDRPRLFDMPREDWELYTQEVLDASSPEIIAYWGFEQNDLRGHCVMINRRNGPFFVKKGLRVTHDRYWRMKGEKNLLSIPHLHTLRGPDLFTKVSVSEPLIEIYSQHGGYETYLNAPFDPKDSFNRGREASSKHDQSKRGPFVRQLLERGLRYGFVACSDHANSGSMGLTAVRAESKTRDGLFDALLARRTFATTGARMWLGFHVGSDASGTDRIVSADDPAASRRAVRVVIHAQEEIASVQVIRNGEVWREVTSPGSEDFEMEWLDEEPLGEIAKERIIGSSSVYYYLRVVQVDDHIGWTSPVFLEPGV